MVVIGGGVGGLVSAALLAARGCDVTLVEAAAGPGGKLRAVDVGGTAIDGGPTVFTMRGVFEEIFAACGASLDDHLTMRPATTLARHAWGGCPARSVRRSRCQRSRHRRFRRCRRSTRILRLPCRGAAAVRCARPAVPAGDQDRSDHARLADGCAGVRRLSEPARLHVDVARARPLFPRSATATTVRSLRHLLRIVAVRRARHADADRACRGERRVADRWGHAPAGAGAGNARTAGRRAVPL